MRRISLLFLLVIVALSLALPAKAAFTTPTAAAWYGGIAATYRYDYGYPYIQIKIGTPNDSYTCTQIQFWHQAGYWEVIPTGTGHWQAYSPFGGFGWSRYFHLKKDWYLQRYQEQEDVRNPYLYTAWCQPYP